MLIMLIVNNIPKKVINLYIHYIPNPWLRNLKFYIEELLIWICRANQECCPDKYKCSDYGKLFGSSSESSFTKGNMRKKYHFFWR